MCAPQWALRYLEIYERNYSTCNYMLSIVVFTLNVFKSLKCMKENELNNR